MTDAKWRHIYRIEIRGAPQRRGSGPQSQIRNGLCDTATRGLVHRTAGGRGVWGHRTGGLQVVTEQGSDPAPTVIIDGRGRVISPLLLGVSMRFLVDPATAAEPPTAMRYEIDDLHDGRCALTIVHDLRGSPAGRDRER